jgi:pimeloyl-ACP methyl ester carboxylesterase
MTELLESDVDFIEAGAGPLVVLAHSSMAGARQWYALMGELETRFRVRAINLFGYGGTPAWSRPQPPSLDDYAELIVRAIPAVAGKVHLVGHSFGGAVAMRAAQRLGRRVESLILVEPSLFYLLKAGGRHRAFSEIFALSEWMKEQAAAGAVEQAAARFIDYWTGPGGWAQSSTQRRSAYAQAVALVLREWDAILTGETTLTQWRERLPARTLMIASAKPMDPSLGVIEVMAEACSDWAVEHLPDGGHMAPITHPHLVNPIIARFLAHRADFASRPGCLSFTAEA